MIVAAKKGRKPDPAPLPVVAAPAPPPPPAPATAEPPPIPPRAADPPAYTWPRRSRCPKCGSLDTERVSDDGPTQYRKCVDSGTRCRARYKVSASLI